MKKTTHVKKERRTAQAMIELAVFGAVLFFLIGGIALNYINGSFQQNIMLQSTRQALLMSYLSSQAGSGDRNSGSFLIFEDRLTGDFGKYGALDRQPVMASGSGMMTAQLMQVYDWGGEDILPVMDVVVNGERFVFRMGVYVSYLITLNNNDAVQIMQLAPFDGWSKTETINLGGQGTCAYFPDQTCVTDADCGPDGPCNLPDITTSKPWEELLKPGVQSCLSGGTGGEYVINCNAGTQEQRLRLAREWKDLPGKDNLPPFFTAMPANDPDFDKIPFSNVAVAFNLARDGDPLHKFPYAHKTLVPAWRWSWDYFWEPKSGESDAEKKKNIKQRIIDKEVVVQSYDVDGDLREELLYDLKDITTAICEGGYCKKAFIVRLQDSKLADVDPAKGPKDFTDPDQKPGLRSGLRIYGSSGCVETTDNPNCDDDLPTYLDVKEGKLFSDGKQVAVSTLKRNQYDVVERVYQLNVNMGDVAGFLKNNSKIAESCGGEGFKGTCFDAGTKTLYIRSRLSDRRGHKWITDSDKRTWGQSLGGI